MCVDCTEKETKTLGKLKSGVSAQSTYANSGNVLAIDCENTNDFIELECPESNTGKLRLLVDSGAQISLIQKKCLQGQVRTNPNRSIRIKGIASQVINTEGTVYLKLRIVEGMEVDHSFHVVEEQLDLPYCGLIGRDFFKKHKVVIDYAKESVRIRDREVKLCAELEPKAISSTCRRQTKYSKPGKAGKCRQCRCRDSKDLSAEDKPVRLVLGPREERILRLRVEATGLREAIIPKQELLEGVYTPEALVSIEHNTCLTTVLNTTPTTVTVECPTFPVEAIPREVQYEERSIRKIDKGTHGLKSRIARLKENIRVEHLNAQERQSIIELCTAYNDVFHLPGDHLTYTNTIRHEIKLLPEAEGRVICSRPYRIPHAQKQALQQEIDKMLQDDIIVPSTSEWNFPLLLIPKKADASGKQKWRVVADYRRLNDCCINTVYPIPRIDEILDGLGKAKYFSTLDLAKGYYQVLLDEKDRQKTAFSTPYGHYEYKRMPMGLKTAPSTFQKLMNSVMMGLQGDKLFIYLDDVVIFGSSLEEHNARLAEAFERLRLHNLKLQIDKCEFLRKEVTYLGHVLSADGLKPDPTKVTAVKEYPQPQTTKQLKSFLGLIGYYRRFINNFSRIARPLHELLKKGENFAWGPRHDDAFQTLKEKIINPPILQYPDFSKRFIITTDSSQDGLGAVLSQGEVGKDLPIAFASRTLNKAEKNYSTIEREMLGIVWAAKYFRPYVFGRKFTICTDHKPLKWIASVTDPSSRLMKFRLKLEEFDYEIVYKSGKNNQVADALSRIREIQTEESNNNSSSGSEETNAEQEISEEDKSRILREFHDSPLGGHQGITRTYDRIRKYRMWPGMKRDIQEYIRKCESCQKNKVTQHRIKMPLEITKTPEQIFERCDIDIVGPLNQTDQGNRYIITFQDALTKFIVAEPIEKQDACTIARVLVEKIILKFGIPSVLLSDQGSNFMSDTLKRVCKLLKIEQIHTTAYHPQSNGALERSHRNLTEFLRHYINKEQSNWDVWVPYAVFVYNTTPHTATNHTPHELFFGRICNIPGILQKNPAGITYNYDDFVLELKDKMQRMHQSAREFSNRCKLKSKEYYDRTQNPKQFKAGDKVLLYDESVRRGRSRKLGSLWRGPFMVVRTRGPNVVIRLKKDKYLTVHANRLKEFF